MIKRKSVIISAAICLVAAIIAAFSGLTVARAANIVKGDTTANIKAVQTRLATLGYYKYKVDGIWGSRTKKAVKKFQRDYGLTADGIVGARTEKALKITLTGKSSRSKNTVSSANLDLLAKCVYAEARGEPYTGQVAIAAVVLNRVKSSSFPNTVSGVIYQKNAFTCVSDGQINLTPNASAYSAAKDALNGWDPSSGAIYYFNPSTATSSWIWSLKVELKIGKHSFARA